jgi:hypothetical protein
MAFTVYVSLTAQEDLAAAIAYYNALSPDLGYRFTDLIDLLFERIAAFPTSATTLYKDVRAKSIRQFPYIILYTINSTAQSIAILRIFNTYREPIG